MCGISGFASKKGLNKNLLYKMSKTIYHRGPDDEGFFVVGQDDNMNYYKGDDTVDELNAQQHILNEVEGKCKIGLVHRRLSILDLSSAGHQPMSYREKYVIVFNGEIYNFIEIRNDLIANGYQFNTQNDTEVILAAYDFWKEECVNKFIGMWAFSLYDLETEKLFLSRDRFGIKPLYYTFADNSFLFASEIKTLFENEKVSRKIDYRNMYHYFTFKKLPTIDATLISGIKELSPGTNMVLDCKSLKYDMNAYYNLDEAVKNVDLNDEDLYKIYEDLFDDSIKLHMRSDVAVGSCLSGGLDSSAIVAFASKDLKDTTLNTFTAAYQDQKIDESEYAKKVINSFNNIEAHFTYPSSEIFWKDLDKLIWYQESPFTGTSVFAQWEVMKLAKKNNIKVLLDGQGADESLGGYSNFTGVYLLELLTTGKFLKFIEESKKIKENRSVKISKELARASFQYMPGYIKKIIIGNKRLSHKMVSQKYHDKFSNESQETPGFGFRDFSMYNIKYGMKNLLRYEDRNSMAFSIESRVPFLDHRLVEFSLAISEDMKLHNGWTKYVLREAIKEKVPNAVVWRKDKKGFVTPQDTWKQELSIELNKFVDSMQLPDFFNEKAIRQAINNENLNATDLSEVWGVFVFFKWVNLFKIEF